jgi:ferredoxin
MPADDVEILEGRDEGVLLHPSLGPKEILRSAHGAVRGVVFRRCLRVYDEERRFAPEFDDGDVVTIPADTVVWCVGQTSDLSFLEPDGDVRLEGTVRIALEPDSWQTTAPDVFVAGDVAYGTKLLIDAIASGKRCARAVSEYLTGEALEPELEHAHVELAGYAREPGYEAAPRREMRILDAERRRVSQSASVELGYDGAEAAAEASRCLDCGVNTIFDSQACILCGGCVDVCPESCLRLVSCDRLVGADDLEDTLRARFGNADLSGVSAIVKDEERCIRCGLCAERCPVDAITMERFAFAHGWVAGAACDPPGGAR